MMYIDLRKYLETGDIAADAPWCHNMRPESSHPQQFQAHVTCTGSAFLQFTYGPPSRGQHFACGSLPGLQKITCFFIRVGYVWMVPARVPYFKRCTSGRGGQSGRGGPLLQSTGQPLQKLVWNRKWEGGSQSGRGGPVLHSFALFSLCFMIIFWFPINSQKVGGGIPKCYRRP